MKKDRLNILNQTEKELFVLMAEGLRISEISKYLSLSYHDAAELSRSVKQKLNVSSITELRKIAVQYGFPLDNQYRRL